MTCKTCRVHTFPDDINTDLIIPFRFKSRTNDPYELAKYAMWGYEPEYAKKIRKGDLFVAGKNFGGGSSREQAPIALKYAGVHAIVAESFARIFFRNAINIGLPILEVPGITRHVKAKDKVEVDLRNKRVTVKRTGKTLQAQEHLTDFMAETVKAGGIVNYYKKHKKFPWEKRPTKR